jgi:hypothetical protein
VGQDEAVQAVVDLYQVFGAGLNSPGRPAGNLLFLGPTGARKTPVAGDTTEVLFGDLRAAIKVDCDHTDKLKMKYAYQNSGTTDFAAGHCSHAPAPKHISVGDGVWCTVWSISLAVRRRALREKRTVDESDEDWLRYQRGDEPC